MAQYQGRSNAGCHMKKTDVQQIRMHCLVDGPLNPTDGPLNLRPLDPQQRDLSTNEALSQNATNQTPAHFIDVDPQTPIRSTTVSLANHYSDLYLLQVPDPGSEILQ